MKGQLLLFVLLMVFSSPLFGVDENTANSTSPVGFHYEDICDKLDQVISPTSSPAVIPDLPRIVCEQNNSDQSKKIKAGFHGISGFIFFNAAYPGFLQNWSSGPTVKKPLFILFRNLRI